MGSRRDLKCAMLHDGVIRRSDDELAEMMSRGMSAAACSDILTAGDETRGMIGSKGDGEDGWMGGRIETQKVRLKPERVWGSVGWKR